MIYDLDLSAHNVDISAKSSKYINISLRADLGQLLDQIDLKDVISHYGENSVLDEIGQSKCEDYFGLMDT